MPYLPFYIRHTSVGFSAGGSFYSGWVVEFGLKIDWLHDVTLSNGLKLDQMAGSAHIRSKEIEGAAAEAIGRIEYSPAIRGSDDGVVRATDESYAVYLTVPEEELQRLIDDVQAGHSPTGMTVRIEGMKYGLVPQSAEWELSRDDRPWKPGESAWLPVESFSLEYGLRVDDQQREEAIDEEMRREAREEGRVYEPPEPPPVSDEVQELRKLTKKVEDGVKWLLILLAALLVATFLRK